MENTKIQIKRPGVGLSILVLNNKNQILLSERLSDHKKMATPGGHLERFEEFEECCSRELLEETNINLSKQDFKYLFFKNIIKKEEDYHYIDYFFACRMPEDQIIKNLESDKHMDWKWFDLETIFSSNLNYFYGMEEFIKEMKNPKECCERLLKAFS